MKVALVGMGRWGSRLIPKLLNNPRIAGVVGYDTDASRRAAIAQDFSGVAVVRDCDSIYKEVDAVVIATPVASHYDLARQALESGKHVLLEKPLTSRLEDASHLVQIARERGLTLMVDHITAYSGFVRKIKELITAREMGTVLYVDAVRANLGMLQRDVNVAWDLAVHEFALLDHLLGEMPRAVSGIGAAYHGKQEEIAYIALFYGNGIIAHVNVSWLSPVKIRRLVIGGTDQTVIYDDTAATDKLIVSTAGIEVSRDRDSVIPRIAYRQGSARVIVLGQDEPLVSMLDEFIGSIEEHRAPMTDGEAGWRTVKVLTAVERSIQQHGVRIPLD
ncbi:Gfo/Idh/MocA family oxidoreductase [candidate division WOR-3 bacterium]|nr:Gfo/Idh/MocA family oxidoreductase [candidate division WOR-3 bacterium]